MADASFCSNCGTARPAGAEFCAKCGNAFGAQKASTASTLDSFKNASVIIGPFGAAFSLLNGLAQGGDDVVEMLDRFWQTLGWIGLAALPFAALAGIVAGIGLSLANIDTFSEGREWVMPAWWAGLTLLGAVPVGILLSNEKYGTGDVFADVVSRLVATGILLWFGMVLYDRRKKVRPAG